MEITKNTKIEDLIPKGREFAQAFHRYSNEIVIQHKKIKTAEELANELGFKIGDKVWDLEDRWGKDNRYNGEITEFILFCKDDNSTEHILGCRIGKYMARYLTSITNKVAIHTLTKEGFDFILNSKLNGRMVKWEAEEGWYLGINLTHGAIQTYLILSIDEYMQSQNINPLIITEDKVNIWYETTCYACNNKKIWKVIINSSVFKITEIIKIFSTEEAAKDYLENLEPKKLSKEELLYERDKLLLLMYLETKFDAATSTRLDRIQEIEALLTLQI